MKPLIKTVQGIYYASLIGGLGFCLILGVVHFDAYDTLHCDGQYSACDY